MVRLIRSDPLLGAALLVCSALVLLPLFFSPFLPLHDLPDHVGLASHLGEIARGEGVAATFYRVQRAPVPYWTAYVVLWLASSAAGPLFAAKVVTAAALLAVPLGLVRLAGALERSPRLAVAAFALAWDHNLYWGFVAFLIGLGVALFALASLVERRLVAAGALAVVVALTHAHAFGLLVVFGLVLSWRNALLACAPAVLVLLPWALGSIGGGGARPASFIEWPPPWARVVRLFAHTAGTNTTDVGLVVGNVVFWTLLIGPPLVALVRAPDRKEARSEPASVGPSQAEVEGRTRWMYGVAWLLYLAVPMGISWPIDQWYVYPRQAALVLLFGLLLPSPSARARRELAAGTALAAMVSLAASLQVRGFGERAAPFLAIVEAVAPESRVLTLTLDDDDPSTKLMPYNQFHAYVFAVRGGYDPHLFDNPSHPVVHVKARALPHPAWTAMPSFSLDAHARHYDYVLVQGLARDPIPAMERPADLVVSVAREAGRWRLYRVTEVSRAGASAVEPRR